jgi:hypothetical protein
MHVSSMKHLCFELVNGDTGPDPHLAACLRVGDNGGETACVPELTITDARRRAQHGRLTWDADHRQNGAESRFFTVAAVRLDMKSDGGCLLSVGTSPFIRFAAAPYRWVERIQVAAAAGTLTPHRSIQWDWIEVELRHADGDVETRHSACLPKIVTGSGVRRAVQAGPGRGQVPRQFVELSTGSTDVVALKLRGQVTLRANEAPGCAAPLGAEDLLGSVLVFTDASARPAPRRESCRAGRR